MSTSDSIVKKWKELESGVIFDTVTNCINHVETTKATNETLKFSEIIVITKQ